MQFIFEIVKELMIAWRQGKTIVRGTIYTAIALVIFAMILVIIGKFFFFNSYVRNMTEGIATVLGIIAGLLALSITAYQKSYEEAKSDERIQQVEKRVQENPRETQAA